MSSGGGAKEVQLPSLLSQGFSEVMSYLVTWCAQERSDSCTRQQNNK